MVDTNPRGQHVVKVARNVAEQARRCPVVHPRSHYVIEPNTTSPSGISVLAVALKSILLTVSTMSLSGRTSADSARPPILVNQYLM